MATTVETALGLRLGARPLLGGKAPGETWNRGSRLHAFLGAIVERIACGGVSTSGRA
jgi:hypothetical protein